MAILFLEKIFKVVHPCDPCDRKRTSSIFNFVIVLWGTWKKGYLVIFFRVSFRQCVIIWSLSFLFKIRPCPTVCGYFCFLEMDIFFSLLAQPHQTFSLLWDRFFKTCNFGAQKHRFLVDERLSGEEMLRFQKHPDTSGRGLNCTYRTVYILSFSVICNSQYISLPSSSANWA